MYVDPRYVVASQVVLGAEDQHQKLLISQCELRMDLGGSILDTMVQMYIYIDSFPPGDTYIPGWCGTVPGVSTTR
jgi:hypothetical protein